MHKALSIAYGVLAYVLFLGAFLYLIAFSMNLGPNIVNGQATLPLFWAVLADVGLIALFGLQHSIMARPGFKRWWTQFVPKHLERSTFVLIAAVLLAVIIRGWQPIEGEIWRANGALAGILTAISLLGYLMVPVVSFLTDHFELFGLRQVFEYATGRPRAKVVFRERAFYKKVRHPMMLAFLAAFWATPHMTVSSLLFAILLTAYILAGIYFEERDLVREHGAAYRAYQARVPKLLPLGTAAAREREFTGKPEAQIQ